LKKQKVFETTLRGLFYAKKSAEEQEIQRRVKNPSGGRISVRERQSTGDMQKIRNFSKKHSRSMDNAV